MTDGKFVYESNQNTSFKLIEGGKPFAVFPSPNQYHRMTSMEASYPEKGYIKVGTYGFVTLVDCAGSDASIAADARVDPEADWRPDLGDGGFNDERLLRTLMLSNPPHSSPFEKTFLKFWVRAPIFVYREWHRHRVWSFNEQSARYKELPPLYYFPEPGEIGRQHGSNHQSRTIEERQDAAVVLEAMALSYATSDGIYRSLLKSGVPREVARSVMPVGIYSEMVASVNLWNFLKFLDLRNHPDAQFEIRQYAKAMRAALGLTDRFKLVLALYDESRKK